MRLLVKFTFPKKHSMIIYSKLDVGKDMDLILTNNRVSELVNLEAMLRKGN